MKINSISSSDTDFPEVFRSLDVIPKQIWIRGVLPPGTYVGIVGSRKPTSYGRQVTEMIAGRLAERGIIVISGLALGVDSIAHAAALAAGGRTVAVLPSGVDNPYPASHRQLADKILKDGALISEYPLGMPALQHHFLERNRLISALSSVLVVTEAASRSGSMNTVMHALTQGKDVYAVPGNITSPLSSGTNNLIATGAGIISDIDLFVDSIAPLDSTKLVFAYSEDEQSIIDLLQQGITDGDVLMTKSNLETGQHLQTMTLLEIRGAIKPLGNNQWTL